MAEISSDQLMCLHGDLEFTIISARRLPNMDSFSENLRRCLTVCDTVKFQKKSIPSGQDRKTQSHRRILTTDPYVTVCVPGATIARTRVISNSQNPIWEEHFHILLGHPMVNLEFQVKDDDFFGAELIGIVSIPAKNIAVGETISGWFPIVGASGKPPKPETALQLTMKFTSCEKNPVYRQGIAGDAEHLGVRNTYFPLRKGGAVTLYQDAHVPDRILPDIELDNGMVFEHHKCWEDICHAISEAHHMIYLVGWSIYSKIKLIRESTRSLPRGGELNLGDLLKYKSEEGVRVLLLVWDDKTSHDKFYFKSSGVMQTHDEETQKFFKNSSVICVLSPRYGSSKLGMLKQQVVGTVFTHHQKCVLVDTQASGNNRKITAFMGGLDLCDGRYDTPEHRLFHNLDNVFLNDFHNPTFPAGTMAPREPWHDWHCKIEGAAAYDILVNFHQRWRKATRWREFSLRLKTKTHWHDDALIKIERISWILSPRFTVGRDDIIIAPPDDDPLVRVSEESNPENWHVQVFRSIDSGSLKGFPKDVRTAHSQSLIYSKKVVIERSIQTAYVQAIRSAQHFIYIENQYFIGSSYAWPSYKDAGADNLIPMELALKIASKIRANERFAVYIVIPMWPEGVTTSGPVQEILYWQAQTMQMMYEIIAREIKSMQLTGSHPLDYLNFYCLGKREELPQEMSSQLRQEPSANGDKVAIQKISDAQKNKRFMIYVHAKGMIVDDEYVILGSANINQRSLAGSKDTEIAMGAYQPYNTWAEKKRHPHGQVYGYRMSLWAEHLETIGKCFEEPESLDCVRRVNEIAVENWRKFADENFTLLEGHLLKYPLQVTVDGKVEPLPGYENFPDVGGKILGSHSTTIPDILTT